MSRGTIIYVGGFELPDKNAAAHRVLNNAKLLKSLNYKVQFIGITKEDKSFRTRINEFEVLNIPYPKTPIEWINYLTNFNTIKTEIDNTQDLVSVICYNSPSIILKKIIKYSEKKNYKVIGDITEWYEDRRPIKLLDTNYRMRFLHKKMAGAICISTFLETYYSKYTQTVVIPPLIDISDVKWSEINFNKTEYIKLVYSGSPGNNKDLLNLIIDAVYKVNNVKLKIVGITKEEYLKINEEHKVYLNHKDTMIEFTGRISHLESIKEVKDSHFQIFLRDDTIMNNAGFPTKFVESMACGTPVITTKISDLKTYLIEGKNGYFTQFNNQASLINLLDYISNLDKEQIYKMKNFSKNLLDFHYENFYDEMSKFVKKTI